MILRTPALEQDMIVLASGDGERPSALPWAGQHDSHAVGATLRGSKFASYELRAVFSSLSRPADGRRAARRVVN